MFTIGEVSKMFHLPVSTLRYYDKEGLFPDMKRQSGIRKFDEAELEALRVIECMKKSGLEIKEIKQFMKWTTEGASTYTKRKELLETRKRILETELEKLQKSLDMLKFKCWYYETAIEDGNEMRVKSMIPDKLPPDVKKQYKNSHS